MKAMDVPATDGKMRSNLAYMIAAAGAVAAIHLAWWVFADNIVLQGRLFDGDSYAHLLRAERLFETGAWFDNNLPRANTPFGGTLHWTRLFDLVLLGLALPAIPFLGVKSALFWAGALVSPLLHILTAVALAWAVRPVLDRTAAWMAGGLTGLQFGILAYATAGHADHHLLYSLITCLVLGCALRSLAHTKHGRAIDLALGGLLAAGLWAGPEFAVPVAVCLVCTAAPWVLGEAGGAARNLTILSALVGGLAAVLFVERGFAQLGTVELDRVSIVYLAFVGLCLGFWVLVRGLASFGVLPRNPVARLLIGGISTAVIAGLFGLLFPDILEGPLAGVDPAIRGVLNEITEFESINSAKRFFLYLGGALFAVPWAFWKCRAAWLTSERWAWGLVVVSLLSSVILTAIWLRAAPYAGLMMSVLLADLIHHLDIRLSNVPSPLRRIFLKAAAVPIVAVGPLAMAVILSIGQVRADASAVEESRACPLKPMASLLNSPIYANRPLNILASADDGPEILYRTSHKVTATLHHPNWAGIQFNISVLSSADDPAIRRLLRQRRIDLILICRARRDTRYLRTTGNDRGLYRRLIDGDTPPWLRRETVPETIGMAFNLYRTDPGGTP